MPADQGDPFDNSSRKHPWWDTQLPKARADQLVDSAAYAFNKHHRTSILLLLFVERKCRLLRCDPAAVVVSEAFDYHTEWMFMSDVLLPRLGADPSATRIFPSDSEWGLMDDAAKECETDVPFVERDLVPGELEDVDVPFKYVQAEDMFGLGRRGYVALEMLENGTAGRFFWLKRRRFYGALGGRGPREAGSTRKRKRGDCTDHTLLDDCCPLHRYVHYRLVVEEVCMPLSSTSGRQLVRLVIDGVIAHGMAVQQGVLHDDVCSGNLLIYPKVKTDVKAGHRHLQWVALLSDWEISSRLDRFGEAPERVALGTNWYTSVALLKDRVKTIEISDELESFACILIEYAVQHLRSNCTRVDDWLQAFFHSDYPRLRPCGQMKLDAVTAIPQLFSLYPPCKDFKFGGPMDGLYKSLLKAFKALYDVRKYDSWQESPPTSPLSATSSPWSAQSPRPPPPSDEDRRKAQHVVSHAGMLCMLCDAMRGYGWGAFTYALDEDVQRRGVSTAGPGQNKRRRGAEDSQYDAAGV
ncbi:hypothetical protein C8Q76DRAFT_692442 [Earliella scabrosa]|nr:hypothetical protein C8Q76DRAFT_692442 [Earliella scabrosa]